MSGRSPVGGFLLGLFAVPIDDQHIEARPHRHGPVATYQVFVDDFNRIEELASSIGSDLTFGTFWLSEAITSTLALPTVPKDWIHVFSGFEVAAFVGYGLGLYFVYRWSKQKNSLKTFMERIRANQIPEFGDNVVGAFSSTSAATPVKADPSEDDK